MTNAATGTGEIPIYDNPISPQVKNFSNTPPMKLEITYQHLLSLKQELDEIEKNTSTERAERYVQINQTFQSFKLSIEREIKINTIIDEPISVRLASFSIALNKY